MISDQVRWFDALGVCACGKPATGTLRGPRNESYGVSCSKCAERRLNKALKEREKEERLIEPVKDPQ
jgi:hypothetical protein